MIAMPSNPMRSGRGACVVPVRRMRPVAPLPDLSGHLPRRAFRQASDAPVDQGSRRRLERRGPRSLNLPHPRETARFASPHLSDG